MTVDFEYLQYGAMFILTLVLLGVGGWVTWYSRTQQKFIEELIEGKDKDNKEQLDEWKQIVKSNVAIQVELSKTISELSKSMSASTVEIKESMEVGHREQLVKISEMINARN